ncbi:MAG: ANTAR domain-containing protein [Phycisphaerales bacterium]|nr:ANTAR domain-containing protein [Phycisphaerales bacterium]
MGKRLRIIAAHGIPDHLASLAAAIAEHHEVIHRCGTVVTLMQGMLELEPDLVVTSISFPDGDGLDTIIGLQDEAPIPSVIVTPRRSLELVERAIRDHVMAYLLEPVTTTDLQAAITLAYARHEQFRDLTEQVGDLKQALAERKIIERAKGVLMATRGLSEGDAYRHLRSQAQDTRTKIIEAARTILDETEAELTEDDLHA